MTDSPQKRSPYACVLLGRGTPFAYIKVREGKKRVLGLGLELAARGRPSFGRRCEGRAGAALVLLGRVVLGCGILRRACGSGVGGVELAQLLEGGMETELGPISSRSSMRSPPALSMSVAKEWRRAWAPRRVSFGTSRRAACTTR